MKAKGLSDADLKRLTIIEGNAKDMTAVKTLLITKPSRSSKSSSPRPSARSRSSSSSIGRSSYITDGECAVDAIVFGIGSSPKLQWSWVPVTLQDTRVCETAMSVLLQALGELLVSGQPKPDVVAVSTTGISSGPRDVPWLYYAAYHWLLHVPHVDKKAMEDLLWAETKRRRSERATRGFVIVRPTILSGGEAGVDSVRWGGEGSPVLGYTVGRKDVGEWIFEKVVQGDEDVKVAVGRDVAVTLAY